MMLEFLPYLLALSTAFLASAISIPFLIPLITKCGFVDNPQTHNHPAMLHTKIIARGGGIPLFIGFLVAGIVFLPVSKVTISIFIAALLSLIVGTFDDKYDISRYLRFGINILCALLVVSGGIGIPFITNPFGGVIHLDAFRLSFTFFGHHSILILSDFLALLWIVWVMNMLNWSKGVDGQMPGIVAISAFVIGILSLRFVGSDPMAHTAAILSFIITGTSLGFLVFNFYPAKIFPGYGATSIYLLLSVASLLSGAKLATAILVMGVPLIDGVYTIIRRMLSGKSPFWHDRKHLHHLLMRLGFGQRRIAITYWLFSAILGTIALTLSSKGKLFAIIMVTVIIGGGIFFLHKFTNIYDKD